MLLMRCSTSDRAPSARRTDERRPPHPAIADRRCRSPAGHGGLRDSPLALRRMLRRRMQSSAPRRKTHGPRSVSNPWAADTQGLFLHGLASARYEDFPTKMHMSETPIEPEDVRPSPPRTQELTRPSQGTRARTPLDPVQDASRQPVPKPRYRRPDLTTPTKSVALARERLRTSRHHAHQGPALCALAFVVGDGCHRSEGEPVMPCHLHGSHTHSGSTSAARPTFLDSWTVRFRLPPRNSRKLSVV